MLTKYELERYDRQIRISGFGKEGQEKLKEARVLVAGAGGLGFPISAYLAAAGIGKMKIVDKDVVELSNLNRQLLHWDKDVGRRKVESAREKLIQINPRVEVEAIGEAITETNVLNLVSDVDAIVDAMDNFPTRFALNKAALKKEIPFFHGAVRGFMGQVTTIVPGETACLRCIFQEAPPPEKFPILGSIAGLIGTIQATEVVKYFTGIGRLLKNKLLVYDGKYTSFDIIELKANPNCPDCKIGHWGD
ncbi:MAG: HesA/MoeB/ThiF family protein [Nitrososphaeria archaeon]|jgi:adenylyltransferase/sulfurtransferase